MMQFTPIKPYNMVPLIKPTQYRNTLNLQM